MLHHNAGLRPETHRRGICQRQYTRCKSRLIPAWFQSTLPRGERLLTEVRRLVSLAFQSTLPRGERPTTHNLLIHGALHGYIREPYYRCQTKIRFDHTKANVIQPILLSKNNLCKSRESPGEVPPACGSRSHSDHTIRLSCRKLTDALAPTCSTRLSQLLPR